jgi:hypothetical protein
MAGALMLHESGFPQRNRLAVFLLDSALETSMRAFLRYKSKIKLSDSHRHRENLVTTAKAKLPDIDDEGLPMDLKARARMEPKRRRRPGAPGTRPE